jgi:hypothetical protein
VTAISTGAGAFHPWLNGTSVANARLNAASSCVRSNTMKRHGCALYADGAQRAASSTACRSAALIGSSEYARGLQRPEIRS